MPFVLFLSIVCLLLIPHCTFDGGMRLWQMSPGTDPNQKFDLLQALNVAPGVQSEFRIPAPPIPILIVFENQEMARGRGQNKPRLTLLRPAFRIDFPGETNC